MLPIPNILMKRSFYWSLILVLLASWKSDRPEIVANNVFDHIRPAYELMEFIANSKFISNYQLAHEELIKDLISRGIMLFPVDEVDHTGNQPGSSTFNQSNALRFISKDKKYQIEILQPGDNENLFEHWKQAYKALGVRSDIQTYKGGSVYLKVKTKEPSMLGALVYTGRNVISVKIPLAFPIPDTYNELSEAEQTIINEKFKDLYRILEAIAKRYVAPAEFVFSPTHGANLTQEQRLYGFIQFWTEVKYNFAFFDQVPDLNWDYVLAEYLPLIEQSQSDDEYYQQLKKICALLNDGHTNIYPPSSVNLNYSAPALQLINIRNKAVVENVSVSLKEDIPIGSEIISVDGMATDQYLQAKVFPYISSSTDHIRWDWGIKDLLTGKIGTSTEIVIKTPDARQKKFTLTREKSDGQIEWAEIRLPRKMFEFKRFEDDIAYVALNNFRNEEIIENFRNHLDTINTCKGLILDLRANGGGNSQYGYEILKHLTNKPFLTSKWRTREHRAAFKAWGKSLVTDYRSNALDTTTNDWQKTTVQYYHGDKWYIGEANTIVPPQNKKADLPLVVLIGHNTASAAEDFLIALDNLKIATTVGAKTFGSTGQPLELKLPGGGSARICTKRDEYPDGRQFVGIGIEPEIYVENTINDFLSRNDAMLIKGIETVKKLMNRI